MKKLAAITLVVLTVMISVALVACGDDTSMTIGTKTDDATALTIKNETGEAISAIAFKDLNTDEYGDALAQTSSLGNEESATLYCPSAASDAGKVATQDIKISCIDGSDYELHDLDLSDVGNASCMLDGDTAYLTYTSISSGQSVSTLDAEKAYEAAKEKAAKKKAAKERAAKKQAAKEKAAKKKAAEEEAAKEESESSSSSFSDADSGSGNSEEEACVPDLKLR